MQQPFGTLLGKDRIGDVEIDVFSNGDCNHVSTQPSLDADGNYMGIQYQCVEFVRRYIYLRYRCNLALRWSAGDAHDWYLNRSSMSLAAIAPESLNVGDILTFSGGKYGHVGVVSKLDKNQCWMTSQNLFNSEKDIQLCLSPAILFDKATLKDAAGADLTFQAALRLIMP